MFGTTFIIELFKMLADNSLLIKSFYVGDTFDKNASASDTYPQLFLHTPIQFEFANNNDREMMFKNARVTFEVLTKYTRETNSTGTIEYQKLKQVNICDAIATGIIVKLEELNKTPILAQILDVRGVTITNEYNDDVVGIAYDILLQGVIGDYSCDDLYQPYFNLANQLTELINKCNND